MTKNLFFFFFWWKSVGYDIYNLYDLGEFAGVRTKYGTKKELLELAKTAKEHDVVIYVDAVLNHKFGADEVERFKVKEVDPNDRTKAVSDLYDIEVGTFFIHYTTEWPSLIFWWGWTKFTFKGRNNEVPLL